VLLRGRDIAGGLAATMKTMNRVDIALGGVAAAVTGRFLGPRPTAGQAMGVRHRTGGRRRVDGTAVIDARHRMLTAPGVELATPAATASDGRSGNGDSGAAAAGPGGRPKAWPLRDW
jgi:hypothetical protein